MDLFFRSANAEMDTANFEFRRFQVLFLERKEEVKKKFHTLLMSMPSTSRDDGFTRRLATGDALFEDFYFKTLSDLIRAFYRVTDAPDLNTPESASSRSPSPMLVDNPPDKEASSSSSSSDGGALAQQINAVQKVKKEEEVDIEPQDGVMRCDIKRRGRPSKMSSNDAQKKKNMKMKVTMPQMSTTLLANAQLLEGTYHTRANARFLAEACAAPSMDKASHSGPSTCSEPMPVVEAVESSLANAIENALFSDFGTVNRNLENAQSPPQPSRPNKEMLASKDSGANAGPFANARPFSYDLPFATTRPFKTTPPFANPFAKVYARRDSISKNALSLANAHSMANTPSSRPTSDELNRCLYPNCTGFSSAYYQSVIRHIRVAHFRLPPSMAQQKRMGIVDHRIAALFVSKN